MQLSELTNDAGDTATFVSVQQQLEVRVKSMVQTPVQAIGVILRRNSHAAAAGCHTAAVADSFERNAAVTIQCAFRQVLPGCVCASLVVVCVLR